MLTLHNTYRFEEAIAAWSSEPHQVLYDDQFVVFQDAVLCLFMVNKALSESCFESPSLLMWKPGRLDYDVDDQYPWLPTAVREGDFDHRAQKWIRRHHILVRSELDTPYFYAGVANLGSYGYGTPWGGYHANFYLRDKLPRPIWLQMGGYWGWEVEVVYFDHGTVHYLDTGDQVAFDALLAEIRGQESALMRLTRYEEDRFCLDIKSRRGKLEYNRQPSDPGVCANVGRNQAIRAASEFFASSQLPQNLHWKQVER